MANEPSTFGDFSTTLSLSYDSVARDCRHTSLKYPIYARVEIGSPDLSINARIDRQIIT